MDERRKVAYRNLLDRAMLDIRLIATNPIKNPLRWRDSARRIRGAGYLADWLHNLAFFSARDFDGFDEEWFWRDGHALAHNRPEFSCDFYRRLFEQQLAMSANA